MQRLSVLNACLATMGQKPLASIDERHPLRAAALALLDQHNRAVQSRGWWFNRETLTISPDTDGRIILPGDCLTARARDRLLRCAARGPVLYNLSDATDQFSSSIDLSIVRLLPFEYLEEVAAQYIAYCVEREFQLTYDGDSDKQRKLAQSAADALVLLNAEETRNQPANWLDSNSKVQRVRSIVSYTRRFIR